MVDECKRTAKVPNYGISTFGSSVLHTPRTGSTQDDMTALWEASRGVLPNYTALIADEQTAGRGRVGRIWYSAPERSLTVSVLVEIPEELAHRIGWLTLIGGAAARAACEELTHSTALKLSWPNDVVVDQDGEQRKIAGILGELIGTRRGKVATVLGMGANLSLTADELPTPTAASLATAGLPVPTREDMVAAWISHLATRVDTFIAADGDPKASSILAEVNRECATLRPGVTVGRPRNTPVTGTGIEILDDGSLVVRTDHGDVVVTSGEVSLFGMSAPQAPDNTSENV